MHELGHKDTPQWKGFLSGFAFLWPGFWDSASLSNPVWPETGYATPASLEPMATLPPQLPAALVLQV